MNAARYNECPSCLELHDCHDELCQVCEEDNACEQARRADAEAVAYQAWQERQCEPVAVYEGDLPF